LKIFEAMAMELPILTLDHPRLRQLLNSDNPLFYYDGGAESLANQIVAFVEHLDELRVESQNFRKRVLQNYSWETHGNKLNGLLNSLTVKQ
jgi:glycosyltransferase involved in cell wall biosynthesis